MKSKIAEAIRMDTEPVALVWANDAPPGASQFKPQRWGCVISLFATAATKGRAGVCDAQTFGCWGGGVGLGFGNQYENFPGGLEGFCRFLSTGNEQTAQGRAIGEQLKQSGGARMADDFLHGERYVKDPECTRRFVESMPMRHIPAKFVVVKPLAQADPQKDEIKNVTFFVDPDRLSALVILANYAYPEAENVIVPWAAACQVMGILAYRELERDRPRGLIGLTDISARQNVRSLLGPNVLSFTAPWPRFLEMESHVEGSFLQRETWRRLRSGEREAGSAKAGSH
jgi:uncharacterized protein (DUF169 family)